jgi:hypothetical protein
MTGDRDEWFHFGPWVFSINAAQALIAATPRPTVSLDVTEWATAYGLTHLDDPHRTSINLIGPTPGSVDRLYAMTTDLTHPLLLALVSVTDTPPAALLIDGIHRLYRAWSTDVRQLPAYVLSAEETGRIQQDRLLGPGGNRITAPLS